MLIQQIFDVYRQYNCQIEDQLDSVQIEVLKLENSIPMSKDHAERDKIEENIDHEREKMQTLEIDLNYFSVQFKDAVARRKTLLSVNPIHILVYQQIGYR